jgi:hypothetical protein
MTGRIKLPGDCRQGRRRRRVEHQGRKEEHFEQEVAKFTKGDSGPKSEFWPWILFPFASFVTFCFKSVFCFFCIFVFPAISFLKIRLCGLGVKIFSPRATAGQRLLPMNPAALGVSFCSNSYSSSGRRLIPRARAALRKG